MTVRFWGVRGTMPTPGAAFAEYGGNTSCVEVNCGGRVLVLDAGTGLYPLGNTLDATHYDIFLSHTHIDHIIGLPYFFPAYQEHHTVHIWAGHLPGGQSIRNVLESLMQPALFPLKPGNFRAEVHYHDFRAGGALDVPSLAADGVSVATHALPHPGGATGYRITYAGKSVCYITDIEHQPGCLDEALVAFLDRTDLLIYDSTYSDEEFQCYKGWGHSTWQHAVKLADAAHVGTLALFHHAPDLDDTAMHQREAQLRKKRESAFAAKEGMVVKLYSHLT